MTDELGRTVAEAGPAHAGRGARPERGAERGRSACTPSRTRRRPRRSPRRAARRRRRRSIPQRPRVSLEDLAEAHRRGRSARAQLIIKADVQGSVEAVGRRARQALDREGARSPSSTRASAPSPRATSTSRSRRRRSSSASTCGPAGKAAALAETRGRRDPALQHHLQRGRRHPQGDGGPPRRRPRSRRSSARPRSVRSSARARSAPSPAAWSLSGIDQAHGARRASSATASSSGRARSRGLRRFKDDVKEVAEGIECGISLDGYADVKEGDIIECFEIEEIKTKL